MHGAPEFLENLATVLCVAGITTVIFQRLRQPVVFGYLVAGMLVGPHIPFPLVADFSTIYTLAELGVILLMFSLGLEFSLRKLFDVVPTAGVATLVETSFMIWLGFVATTILVNNLFAGRGFKVWAIEAGNHIVFLLICGGILAVWR